MGRAKSAEDEGIKKEEHEEPVESLLKSIEEEEEDEEDEEDEEEDEDKEEDDFNPDSFEDFLFKLNWDRVLYCDYSDEDKGRLNAITQVECDRPVEEFSDRTYKVTRYFLMQYDLDDFLEEDDFTEHYLNQIELELDLINALKDLKFEFKEKPKS